MNGAYRVPLEPGQDPAQNPKVKALLRALDIGAEYTLTIHDVMDGASSPLVLICSNWDKPHNRWVEIRAIGGKPRPRPSIRISAALRDHHHRCGVLPPPTLEELEDSLKWAWHDYRESTNPTPENNRLNELEIEYLEEMIRLAQIKRFGKIIKL